MYGFYKLGEALYELSKRNKNDKKGTYIAYNKESKLCMIKEEETSTIELSAGEIVCALAISVSIGATLLWFIL